MTDTRETVARTSKLSDWRKLWRQHGGDWHGPRVEKWTIPEDNFCAFMDAAIAAMPPVRVKALEWGEASTDKDTGMVSYVGVSTVKTYTVWDWRSVPNWNRNYFGSVGIHETLEAAIAAYEATKEQSDG